MTHGNRVILGLSARRQRRRGASIDVFLFSEYYGIAMTLSTLCPFSYHALTKSQGCPTLPILGRIS
eukprot:2249649-Amphidinium_carterae.1